MECHIEAAGTERRKSALNGNDWSWMGQGFLRPRNVVPRRDVVEDALDDDDPDMNAAGNVRKELVKETVNWVESIARQDAGSRRRSIGFNTGNVKLESSELIG